MDAKDLERVLVKLHGEYVFEPAVDEARKQWWMENCLHCLQGFIHVYAKFSPDVQSFYWEEYWGDFGISLCISETLPHTKYEVTWEGFTTTFLLTEAVDKTKRAELLARGVPGRIIDYAVSLLK